MRSLIIGQPEPFEVAGSLGAEISVPSGRLQVLSAPGHCDDHIVLYDPAEKLLISGDAFIGTYFSSPNPDVDSSRWLESTRRLAELPIEVMLTGHGQIFTCRADFPDFPGVVIRRERLRARRGLICAGFPLPCLRNRKIRSMKIC